MQKGLILYTAAILLIFVLFSSIVAAVPQKQEVKNTNCHWYNPFSWGKCNNSKAPVDSPSQTKKDKTAGDTKKAPETTNKQTSAKMSGKAVVEKDKKSKTKGITGKVISKNAGKKHNKK